MASDRPAYLLPLLAFLAVLSVVVPFLVWHETWFGRRLSDAELERYLQDKERPRRIQHALSQVSERIVRDGSVERLYPKIADLARHPAPVIRTTAAWVMGQDNHSELFRRTLLGLLQDSQPMVRRNAALSLVRFADSSGRSELLHMLQPDLVSAPAGGEVRMSLDAGQEVGSGTLLARIHTGEGGEVDVRSPYSGEVVEILAADRSTVAAGQPVASIRAGGEQIWEALRALYLVGRPEDLPAVEEYTHATGETPPEVREQARLTAQAIRNRSARGSTR